MTKEQVRDIFDDICDRVPCYILDRPEYKEMVFAVYEALFRETSRDKVFETYCDTCSRKSADNTFCDICKHHEFVPFNWKYDNQRGQQTST